MELKHTSRLENLVLAPDRASFALDGRPILIEGDGLAATRKTFQALYASALAEYEASQAPRDRGVLAWLGRLWSRPHRGHPPPPTSHEITASYSGSAGPSAPAPGQPPPVAPSQPSLHSIFADQDGIHVQWRHPQPDGPGAALTQTVEATYGVDSEVGRRLERCYAELSKLGYPVRNLASLALAPNPPAAGSQDSVPSSAKSDTVPAAPISPSTPAGPASPVPAPQPPPNRPLIFRLHFTAPDFPTRAIITPVDHPDRPEVLVAHERFIRALQAATDESNPLDRRVTFLRCAKGEKGVRVVEIGLGTGPDREPARWQEATAWWESAGRSLAKPPPLAGAVPSPKFAPGGSPLQTGVPVEPSIG